MNATVWLFRNRVCVSIHIYRNWWGSAPFARITNNGGRSENEVLDINWVLFWIVGGSFTLWRIGSFARVLRFWRRT